MRKLFFLHIPKCAGTSIWTVLADIYGRENVLQSAHLAEEQLGRYRVVGGHVGFAGLNLPRDEYCRMVVLREPAERAVSEYHFIRACQWHPYHHLAVTMSFEDFVDGCMTHNLQTRMICGREDADAAIRVLEDEFDVVVRVPEVDALISRLYADSDRPERRFCENATRGHVSQDMLEHVRPLNAVDVDLYDRVTPCP